MDFLSVVARLNDLPNTFKRPGPPYTQLIDSIAVELAGFTLSMDATFSQVEAFGAAVDGWLDVWGLLWGVPRQANEANTTYLTRISNTVLAWVGTLPALQAWVNLYATGGNVVENNPAPGYTITLPGSMTSAQIAVFLPTLNRIRPAGVPFVVLQASGGLYLGTEAFLGAGGVMGSYLASGTQQIPIPFGPCTPNAMPLLPTLLLSDPTLNPSLA